MANGTASKELTDNDKINKAERILKRSITDACDNSMKREKVGKNTKGKVYRWSTEIAEIRGRCNMWRRRLIRAKCRKDPEQVSQLVGELKASRKELKKPSRRRKRMRGMNYWRDSTGAYGNDHTSQL